LIRWNWLPWRWVISKLARSHGFLDPIAVLSRLHRFAQPSEVTEPIELLRAGAIFHARGLMNTRAIQHNLDWVWPWWIEQQFDPESESFIPRAFSITHVNLTHRNWTTVGMPEADRFPIVDPRGLVTPHEDGWSVDAWIIPDEGEAVLPSRCRDAVQSLSFAPSPVVETRCEDGGHELTTTVDMIEWEQVATCRLRVHVRADSPGWLVISPRPVNPEGVVFIQEIAADEDQRVLRINEDQMMVFDAAPDRLTMSEYAVGDVLQELPDGEPRRSVACRVGMATAAAMFRLDAGSPRALTTYMPLAEQQKTVPALPVKPEEVSASADRAWEEAISGACEMKVPDERMNRLFDAAVHTLVQHSPGEVYPGPYTYKRFWFRDAAYILHGLLLAGFPDRVARCLADFPDRQTVGGYFRSQEGEWDSNGEAIWIMARFARFTGRPLDEALVRAVARGADWIGRKRTSTHGEAPHAGLLPAGFSAEHLGPNDYYYWDDFWSVAGLQSAAKMFESRGEAETAGKWRAEADDLLQCIERSVARTDDRRARPGIPASPYRRMDTGAVGSLAAGYPLNVWPADHPRLLGTVDFLIDHCLVHGGLFQDMIHSGINAYLTLHIAQVLLQAGDPRWFRLIEAVRDLASPTGQWPEAIHPRTRGGCMGDGQHVWAAAEWLIMLRHCFVYEEEDRLVIGAGLPTAWTTGERPMSLGPTLTPWGPVSIEVQPGDGEATVNWTGAWRGEPPSVLVRLPGFQQTAASGDAGSIIVPIGASPSRATENVT